MAGVVIHIPSGEVSLLAATAKTVLSAQAVSNHRALLRVVEVFFKGIVTTGTPVLVDLIRITAASGTASAATEVKNNEGDNETIQTVGRFNFSAEPTVGDVIKRWEVHPQTGLIFPFPPGLEPVIIGGNEIALRCNAAEAVTCSANFTLEE